MISYNQWTKRQGVLLTVGAVTLFSILLLLWRPVGSRYGMTNDSEHDGRRTTDASLDTLLDGVEVIAAVFYGRRETVSIMDCYLQRNLKINGGVLDKVHFFVNTENDEDLLYLDTLLAANPAHYGLVTPPRRGYGAIYSSMKRDTLYIKMDDDIVWMGDRSLRALAREQVRGRYHIVSANVVNHPLLSGVHARHGAVHPYTIGSDYNMTENEYLDINWRTSSLPTETIEATTSPDPLDDTLHESKHRWHHATLREPVLSGQTTLDSLGLRFGYGPFDDCSWRSWKCAANVHYSFFQNIEEGHLDRYRVGLWDLHSTNWERYSINVIAFFGRDILNYGLVDDVDDERYISELLPAKTRRRHAAVGDALVSHYAYGTQKAGLAHTDILERYRSLAIETASCPATSFAYWQSSGLPSSV